MPTCDVRILDQETTQQFVPSSGSYLIFTFLDIHEYFDITNRYKADRKCHSRCRENNSIREVSCPIPDTGERLVVIYVISPANEIRHL